MSDQLHLMTLADGLPVERDGKTIRYRTVRLRETSVGDERTAQRLAERVMLVGGQHKLLVSDGDFQYALTMLHIEAFECDGQRIGQPLIDLALIGKLSPHDWGLIEARVFLVNMAAEVRYGTLSEDEFAKLMAGQALPGRASSPQPEGQAAQLGRTDPELEPGPALLADYVGIDAGGAPDGAGQ